MAKNGSGRVLSFTRAATTVVGTVASCHPLGTKVAVEMISPLASTLAEDCSVQCSRRASLSVLAGVAGLDAGVSAASRKYALRNDMANNCAAKRVGKAERLAFAFAEFMLLPCVPSRTRACSIVFVDLDPGTMVRELRGITRLLIRFNSRFVRAAGMGVLAGTKTRWVFAKGEMARTLVAQAGCMGPSLRSG